MAGYEINMVGIETLFADPAGPVGQIMEHKALMVEGIAKSLLLIPGSGRLYTTRFFRGREGRPLGNSGALQEPGKLYSYGERPPHRASAPGMSPASDTGQLLASVGHHLVITEGVVTGRVFADKAYALYRPGAWDEVHGTKTLARSRLGGGGEDVTCSVAKCGLPVRARGWCTKHYYRWVRTGDPLGLRRLNPGSEGVRYPQRPRKVKATRLCESCGESFPDAPANLAKLTRCPSCRAARPRSTTAVCPVDGTEFSVRPSQLHRRRTCSRTCANRLRWIEQEPDTGYIAWKRRTGYRTNLEALAEGVLQAEGIIYAFEMKVGRYSVDFALTELRVALECDGPYHTPLTLAREAVRDAYLAERGWRVVRIPGAALKADAEGAVREALAHV